MVDLLKLAGDVAKVGVNVLGSTVGIPNAGNIAGDVASSLGIGGGSATNTAQKTGGAGEGGQNGATGNGITMEISGLTGENIVKIVEAVKSLTGNNATIPQTGNFNPPLA